MITAEWHTIQYPIIMLGYKVGQQKGPHRPAHNHFSQVKLPLLDKRPPELFKKSLSKIRSGKLPLLHLHETNFGEHPRKPAPGSQIESPTSPSPDSSNFAQQIGERVNEIMNKNQLFNMDYYTSENGNFEQHIAKNKEFLKEQREKRASILKRKDNEADSPRDEAKRPADQKRKEERPKLASKAKKRHQSPLVGNSKSESVLTNDEQALEKRKGRGVLTNRLEKKMQDLKTKLGKRKKESKLNTQGDVEDAMSENLFDNIHNYLANPQRLSFDLNHVASSKSPTKRAALESKLRQIEQKMSSLDKGVHERGEYKQETLNFIAGRSPDEYGVSDWRRVEFLSASDRKSQQLSMRESNFEKEVNHITLLQQRNELSLEKYLQNQRMLFDLKFIKSSSKEHLHREFRSK